jgi:hypothetical protein
MPLTFEDLTREILAELGALDASNVASNEDAVRVAQRAPTVYLDLVAARVVPLFSLATIPEPYFPGLVRIIAEYLAPSFGRPTQPALVAEAQSRLAAIYRLDRAGGMSSLALAVLERLEAIGGNTLAQAELATSDVVYFGAEKDISLQATPSVVRYIAAGLSPKPLYDVLAAEKANLRLIRPPIEIGPEPVLSEYY